VPFDADGNFSWERFEERYTSDLANGLGNLASRTIAMIEKYCDGAVPNVSPAALAAAAPWVQAEREAYRLAMNGLLLHEALAAAWRVVARANEYVDRQAPWKLAKDASRTAELHDTLAALAWVLAHLALMLEPFMPTKAQELWRQLGGAGNVDEHRWPPASGAPVDSLDPAGWHVEKGVALFPRETAPA